MDSKAYVTTTLCFLLTRLVGTAGAVDYQDEIKPLLASKCASCHGALKQESGLRLDAEALILAGSSNGPVVVPGDAAASLLVARLTAQDAELRMPPEGEGEPLDAQQIALVVNWINAAAKVPDDEVYGADPAQHWAYQPPSRPALPSIDDLQWSHPIDAFLAHERRRLGLAPVTVADRATLLRRLYLNLIGLPPTREQRAFEANDSPEAWQSEVDAVLDNAHYGERWGRHWMDVWRDSDWNGYKDEVRGSQRHIWRWRDWIVNSLNADKGYDRMVVEMLAGDELVPNDPEALSATGFLVRNYRSNNRDMWLDATVEHTAKAFLGVTINCARCHDHKFDPLPQTAYYQFRAIFEPHHLRTDQLPGEPDLAQDGLPRAFDAEASAETYLYRDGNEKLADKQHPMKPEVPAILGGRFDISPVSLSVEDYYPALLPHVRESQLAAAQAKLDEAKQALVEATAEKTPAETTPAEKRPAETTTHAPPTAGPAKSADIRLLELRETAARLAWQSLAARQAADRLKYGVGEGAGETSLTDLARAAAAAERQLAAHAGVVAVREKEQALRAAESSDEIDAEKKQQAVATAQQQLAAAWKHLTEAQAALANRTDQYTSVGKEYPRTSSGRRLALARWITAAENPLTARVAVNHIWLRQFGAPLVDNVFDFGLRSSRPRHAHLLDWLAIELIENDWSMKHLHRLIVTSRTWQLASSGTEEAADNVEIDRDNRFFWRMNVRRLEAEIVRDSLLAVAGKLDPTIGGADIDFREGETSLRRSLYLRHAYEKQMTMLVQFDTASPSECYRRSESVVPQQALAMVNSSLALGKSRQLAELLWQEVSSGESAQADFVQEAYRQVLSRRAVAAEIELCLEFLTNQAALLTETAKLTPFRGGSEAVVKPSKDPQQRARENLIHVLMNHNDFITVR